MTQTLAFDVYGTLIDTQGVSSQLVQLFGPVGQDISRLWRQKQLEYSFRRGLMQDYCGFDTCTEHALQFACAALGVTLSQTQAEQLLAAYTQLPAYPDVAPALHALQRKGHPLYAFSNGNPQRVEQLLEQAHIRSLFTAVVSVEAVQTFKPAPAVYDHLRQVSGSPAETTWLISSNPFDILGALHAGWKTAWLQRDPAIPFDPWGPAPQHILHHLGDLADSLP